MNPKPEELQNVANYKFDEDEIALHEYIKADGDRAYLAHPIWRCRLFPVGRRTSEKFWTNKYINEFGDRCYVFAPERLKPCPDMSIMLTTIALIQHYGQHALEVCGRASGFVGARVPMDKLLKANKIKKCNRQRLIDSIQRLGGIHIQIDYADPNQHMGSLAAVVTALWGAEIHEDEIIFVCHKMILPRLGKLYRNASTVTALKSDTSRGVFWALGAREHYRGTLKQWRELIGVDEPKWADKWYKRTWLPAIQELKNQGYGCRKTMYRGIEYWSISMPCLSLKTSDSKATQICPKPDPDMSKTEK